MNKLTYLSCLVFLFSNISKAQETSKKDVILITNAVFLGDRIQVENLSIEEGNIMVQYLDRNPGEPMSNKPSVLHQRTLQASPVRLEDAPQQKPVTGREWQWIRTAMNNDETIVPAKPDAFTIKFNEDGSFTGTTDCNRFFGEYTLQENKLQMGPIGQTRMFCEGSQEDVFIKQLQEVNGYFVDEDGQLILLLKYDSGSMVFR